MNELAVINEIRRNPVLSAHNAIAPHLEVREKGTDKPLTRLYSLNVQTGEAEVVKLDPVGQPATDAQGRNILETVFLDLKLYYLAFKSAK